MPRDHKESGADREGREPEADGGGHALQRLHANPTIARALYKRYQDRQRARVMRAAAAATATATATATGDAGADHPAVAQARAARGGGAPLPAGLRAELERQLGVALGAVRIHTDATAAAAAQALHAKAFTLGDDIFFADGAFAPSDAAGKQLLVHELTHVAQHHEGRVPGGGLSQPGDALEQEAEHASHASPGRDDDDKAHGGAAAPEHAASDGAAPPTPSPQSSERIQRDVQPGAPAGQAAPAEAGQAAPAGPGQAQAQGSGITFSILIPISEPIGEQEALLRVVKQWRGCTTDGQAAECIAKDHIHFESFTAPTPEEVQRGFAKFVIYDGGSHRLGSDEAAAATGFMQGLEPAEQSAIAARANAETKKKLGLGKDDNVGEGTVEAQQTTDVYLMAVNDILAERAKIESLPENVRAILLPPPGAGGHMVITPQDYATILRIGQKLAKLPPSFVDDLRSRGTRATTDWDAFEKTIDSELAASGKRDEEGSERERLKAALSGQGLAHLYAEYKYFKHPYETGQLGRTFVQPGQEDPETRYQRFRDELKANGFESVEAFEKTIHDFEASFEHEALNIGLDLIARYRHLLLEEEQKYQDPIRAASLYKLVAKSGAKDHYAESEAAGATGRKEKKKTEHASAESAVNSAAEDHPLVHNENFNRDALAHAPNQEAVQQMMMSYIADRKNDLAIATSELMQDKAVFGLDKLMQAAREQMGVTTPGTLPYLVIKDAGDAEKAKNLERNVVTAILAVALTLGTAGTGAAAAGAAVSFALSAGGVFEALHGYFDQSAFYGAKLVSERPSALWIVFAVAGAAADLGGLTSALKVASAASALHALGKDSKTMEAIEKAIAGHDEAALQKLVDDALEELPADQQSVMRARLLEAAKREMEQVKTAKSIQTGSGNVRVALSKEGPDYVKLLELADGVRNNGALSYDAFLAELKSKGLIDEIEALTPQEETFFKQAYADASKRSWHGSAVADPRQKVAQLRRDFKDVLEQEPELRERLDHWQNASQAITGPNQEAITLNWELEALESDMKRAHKEMKGVAPDELIGSAGGEHPDIVVTVPGQRTVGDVGASNGSRCAVDPPIMAKNLFVDTGRRLDLVQTTPPGRGNHNFLHDPATGEIIDPGIYSFFNVPDGEVGNVFVGNADQLKATVKQLYDKYGTKNLGKPTLEQLYADYWEFNASHIRERGSDLVTYTGNNGQRITEYDAVHAAAARAEGAGGALPPPNDP